MKTKPLQTLLIPHLVYIFTILKAHLYNAYCTSEESTWLLTFIFPSSFQSFSYLKEYHRFRDARPLSLKLYLGCTISFFWILSAVCYQKNEFEKPVIVSMLKRKYMVFFLGIHATARCLIKSVFHH